MSANPTARSREGQPRVQRALAEPELQVQGSLLWAEHPIVEPGPITKAFKCFGLGTVRVRASSVPIPRTLDCRMVVYLPESAADVALIAGTRSRVRRRLRPA